MKFIIFQKILFRNNSIYKSLLIIISLISLLIISIILFLFYFVTINEINEEINHDLEENIARLSYSLGKPLWDFNNKLIEQILNIYIETSGLSYINLVDYKNNKIFFFKKYDKNLKVKNKNIYFNNKFVGKLEIGVNKNEYFKSKINILFSIFINGISVFIAIVIANIFCLKYFLKKPLRHLEKELEKVKMSNFNYVIEGFKQNDLNRIVESINKMSSEIILRNNELKLFTDNIKKVNKKLKKEINEKTKLQKQLIEEEKKWFNIINNSSEGFIQTNKKGELLFFNKTLYKMLGYNNEYEMKNTIKNIIDIYVDSTKRLNFIEIIEKNGFIKDFEYEILKKDGSSIWVSENSRLVKDCDLNTYYYEGTIKDISYKKDLEKIIIQKEMFESSTRVKSEFLAHFSHEIRTPINLIMGYTDLLNEYIVSDKGIYYLKSIKTSCYKLLNLINDILDLAKIESGKFEISFAEVNIIDLINEVYNNFSKIALNKRLMFNLYINENIPNILLIDELRIKQIIVNLLDNAFKFTNSGFVNLSLDYRYQDGNNIILYISVEDSGIGIPKNFQKKIFDLFFNQEFKKNKNTEGAGLGLTITKKLVEKLNGKIELQSEENKGSIFNVALYNIKVINYKEKVEKIKKHNISYEKKNFNKIEKQIVNKDLSDLYNILNTDILKKVKELKETFIFDEIKDFALFLIQLGNENNYFHLIEYGNQLYNETENYDINKISLLLDKFSKLVDTLRKELKKNK